MMLKRILRRNFRQPLYSMAVLTFSLVLTVVLCYLHHSALQEQKQGGTPKGGSQPEGMALRPTLGSS